MVSKLARRDQVNAEDTWDLAALFESAEAWEVSFGECQERMPSVAAYQGRLSESAATLAEAIEVWLEAQRHAERVYVYAHLRADEDLGNGQHQQMLDRARGLYARLSAAGAYIAPETMDIADETMAEWLDDRALVPYRFWLEELLRHKPHTLSPAEERLLALVSEPLGALEKIYSVLKNVDLAARLPEVPDTEGRTQLTHAEFIRLQESRDRNVRREAFQAYYGEWAGNRATVAAALDGAVRAHLFEAQARGFGSCLEASLFQDQVTVDVYQSLIDAVHQALPAFHRYMGLRKRLLGVDALHMYDVYVPVVAAADPHYAFSEATELILAALAPLGSEYVATLREGLAARWVDRYENAGKRSGAYSSGCYDSPPYMLLNYTGTTDAMFTLAHEAGHSMHSWFSKQAQSYHLADYAILVAEVASTANESLLTDYLLKVTDDEKVRAYLVDRYLDSFRATLFRQVMFAEFEWRIHRIVEEGGALTTEVLDEAYLALVRLYFGDAIAFDEADAPIAWEWARVDHFFYDFYVYKYATGMASAIALMRRVLEDGEPARRRYLDLVRAGGNGYPLELLRRAGVDLTTPQPVSEALNEFQRMVAQFEQLTAR